MEVIVSWYCAVWYFVKKSRFAIEGAFAEWDALSGGAILLELANYSFSFKQGMKVNTSSLLFVRLSSLSCLTLCATKC